MLSDDLSCYIADDDGSEYNDDTRTASLSIEQPLVIFDIISKGGSCMEDTACTAHTTSNYFDNDNTNNIYNDNKIKCARRKVSFTIDTAEPTEDRVAISITKHEDITNLGYTAYFIQCWYGGKLWTVQRRYRHFEALHKELESELSVKTSQINLPALPKKRWFEKQRWINRFDNSYSFHRRMALQCYIRSLLSYDVLLYSHSKLLDDFLELSKHKDDDSNHTCCSSSSSTSCKADNIDNIYSDYVPHNAVDMEKRKALGHHSLLSRASTFLSDEDLNNDTNADRSATAAASLESLSLSSPTPAVAAAVSLAYLNSKDGIGIDKTSAKMSISSDDNNQLSLLLLTQSQYHEEQLSGMYDINDNNSNDDNSNHSDSNLDNINNVIR